MRRHGVMVVLLVLASVAATRAEEGIRNFLRLNEQVCTGGQPTLEQLAKLKADGVRGILNLRRPTEKQTLVPGGEPIPYDAAAEEDEARRLGLKYFNIPVDGEAPTDAQVKEFLKVTADQANRPLFIHCSSANRVGGFWMIRRVLVDGWSVEEAEKEARLIGLRNPKTEAFARDYIARHSGK
ncbi:MAG TPA: protein tyrosine phosphatase family protein [Candidatus Xenobia bacterium]|nr:protein tyrosine phosphatase family protein [Candidatus Xenobia bacterium]